MPALDALLLVETLLVGVPVFVVATRVLGFRSTAAVAVLHDASPLVSALAWPGLALSVIERWWVVALAAGAVCAAHVGEVRRLLHRDERPEWVVRAPTITVAVANVFVDNEERTRCAAQLVGLDVDVLIVVETTPEFRADFDSLGGRERFPARVFDPDDHSDYAVSLYAREPGVVPMMRHIGPVRVAAATLEVGRSGGGAVVEVIGAIPAAAVDPGGYERWRRETAALARHARRSRHPLVIAGDLNTTIHRAAFKDLADAGLRDAHDTLGLGLRPSFMLAARGLLARLGPLVRLDHALVSDGVWPVEVEDLDPVGSDHRPFIATLAVRTARRAAGERFVRERSAPRRPHRGVAARPSSPPPAPAERP